MTSAFPTYWLETAPIAGSSVPPRDGQILVIGSGLSGASCAYWLAQEGFSDVTLVDDDLIKAATFRNCGHILHGTVESMQALVALYGYERARAIWGFSVKLCQEVQETIARLGVEVDYRHDGYLVIAIDPSEDSELLATINLLQKMGFRSDYWPAERLAGLGFKATFGGRFEPGSAQAHPVKFRNALIAWCLRHGLKYHSGVRVRALAELSEGVEVDTSRGRLRYDAVVIAANAYSPLLSEFFASQRLVEPFRGQIITSRPLRHHHFQVRYPHSFDHGYEYALVTSDNRLMIGGWRNNTPAGEVGTYDITPNPLVEEGLREFVSRHYNIKEKIDWEYSWAGIMASSKTGLPFIGPTSSPRIYTCAGYSGHGFSWAHGSAKLLAAIIAGRSLEPIAGLFNPALF